MKIVSISIPNWRAYNPRTDRAKHSWLRLENNVYVSQDLFDLKPEQRWVWICLLCLASKQQAEQFTVNTSWLAQVSSVSLRLVTDAINRLAEKGLITLLHPAGDRLEINGHTTDKQTDITDKQNDTRQRILPETLLELYSIYPKKIGKSEGLKRLAKELSSTNDVELFRNAVFRYKDHCEKSKVEPQFIKHFSSFISSWRDWIDPESGSSEILQAPSGVDLFLSKYAEVSNDA